MTTTQKTSSKKLKKLLLFMMAAIVLSSTINLAKVPVFAASKVTATIPSYKVELDYEDVDCSTSKYPLINYKGITYFPMTWGYSRLLGLTSVWIEGEGLFLASWGTYGPSTSDFEMPVYKGSKNPRTVSAAIADYPIYVNGTRLDKSKEEYPILNFRGITYFPLTWRFAREEFDWDTNWSKETNTFSIHWQIDDDTSCCYTVYEENESGAYIEKNISKSVPIREKIDANGEKQTVYTVKNADEYYFFDYLSGKLTESEKRESYTAYENGDSSYLPVGHLSKDLKIRTDIEYTRDDIPAPYTPFIAKGYVSVDGKEYYIGEGIAIEDAFHAGDYVFVNARRYTGYRMRVSGNYELYRIDTSKDTVERLDTQYAHYASMKLLGTDKNGTLYIKCQQGSDSCRGEGGTMEASAYNDGYYIMNPNSGSLRLCRRFVYTDGDILTPDGHIYGIFNWKDRIEKLY
jgi:hypothetical protein